jgi:nucleotide-binding universal stress UspA family protein
MYDRILVPTDGSDHALRAAEHALAIGRAFDATVHVLSVLDVQGRAGVFSAGGVGEEFVGKLREEAEAAIADIESVADADDDLRTEIHKGDPADTISEYVADNDIEMVAMGTHGRKGINRYVAGSVTEYTVRHTPVPVLTARATERRSLPGEYDDVLIPTDGSEAAEAAVEHGLALAGISDARVHALNVVNIGDMTGGGSASVATDLLEQFRAAGEDATARIANRAEATGLDTVTEVVEGFPSRDLLDYADEHEIDLITMGTRGRTGMSRFLLGSTTERAIRHADMPVLAVNTREDAASGE